MFHLIVSRPYMSNQLSLFLSTLWTSLDVLEAEFILKLMFVVDDGVVFIELCPTRKSPAIFEKANMTCQ